MSDVDPFMSELTEIMSRPVNSRRPIEIITATVDNLAGYIEPGRIAVQIIKDLEAEGFSIRRKEGV